MVLNNYFKIALRNICRNKIYSLINILGLSIGLAVFILIALYVKYEFSFDKYHKNADNIYRVATEFSGHDHAGSNKMAVVRCPLAPALKAEFPEVSSIARIMVSRDIKIKTGEQSFFEEEIFFTDPKAFEIFTLPLLKGDINNIFNEPFTVIISEKIANKYFGGMNPVGQTIQYMEEFDFRVSAVMKDMPKNSHFVMDLVFPINVYPKITEYDLNSWHRSSAYTYLTFEAGTDLSDFDKKMTELYLKHDPPRTHGPHAHSSSLFLQPLTSIHLYSQLSAEIAPNNDINNIYLFLSIAFLILLIACFNYMNLTTANSMKRNREVGIRKTLGAEKIELIKQFLSESLLFTFFALLIALFIIEIILPTFNSFFEGNLQLFSSEKTDFLLWLIVIAATVGLFSGIYPAFVISSFKPMKIFNIDHNAKRGKIQLRSIFVVIQFSISIILIISTLIISGQLDYIRSTDVGFQKDQIVTIPVRGEEISSNLETIKTELKKQSSIIRVSSSTYLPNRISDQTSFSWTGKTDETETRCYVSSVDYDYVDLYGISIIEGRKFSREHAADANGAFLINETAVKVLGWKDPLKYELIHWSGKTGRIVGVVKDFNFHSLHRNIEPLYLFLDSKERNYFISVKIAGGAIKETLNNIEKTLASFSTKYPFEYTFFDEIFNKAYREEMRMERLLNIFAVLAIFISCMGLLGLALYTIEKRTKEIGIRKVLGATDSGIAIMLSKEFTKWVLIANIIAWPIAWYIMNTWLQNFAYKMEMDGWIFVLSGGSALIIAVIAVSTQAIRAAISNPVESLRYE